MNMVQFKSFVPLFLCLLLPPGARAAESIRLLRAPVRNQYRETGTFILLPDQKRVDLGRTFLIQGTDSVTVQGRILRREDDYRINTLKGVIILVEPAVGGEKLEVSWSRYPFSFPPVFAARFPGENPLSGFTAPVSEPRGGWEKRKGTPYRLRLSGSKTIGFTLGSNRGLGIDQSLKVTMSGKLAKDLEVKATLTDDNLPVQPEGNTEELRHLDKVYVQVKSRYLEAQLGDFKTGMDWSHFSSFERELRGATIATRIGGQKFFAGGGIAKGRFRTTTIRGREGVQGPYELLDARRFNGVVILSGTETVYLDGNRLRRGSEKGYTIDYNRGTVTFTEKITITGDSEIVIDYQMGEDDFTRSTVTAGWSAPLAGGGVTMRTFFFQENDNSDEPVRRSLSKDDKALLGQAGDDPGGAIASGIEEVENTDDCYIFVPADTVPGHYLFVESGGHFRLAFYKAGKGEGDYETDGFTRRGEVKYRYAGEGNGSYRTGRELPLPERKRVFAVGVKASKGKFFIDAEGDLSQYDRNTLSTLDDRDNSGGALKVQGGVSDIRISSSSLSLTGEYSMLEARFESPDKTREPYFYRNWNLEDVPLTGREEITGVAVRWKGDTLWDVSGSMRNLSREGGLTASRNDFTASLGDVLEKGIGVKAFNARTGDDRDRRFARAEGAFGFWKIVARTRFDTERYRSFVPSRQDTGRYYYQNTVSIAGRDIGPFRGDLSYSVRRTDRMAVDGGLWSRDRESDEIRFDGGYNGNSRIIDIFITHRVTRVLSTGLESTHDLARMRFRDSWESAGITTDIGYRISSGEDRRLEKAVIFVGEKEGDYDEEGREVGQKRGDYMVLYLPGGEVEAVRTVELTWRMSVGSGLRGFGARSGGDGLVGVLRRNISLDHFFSVIEKSGTDELLRLYLLDPELMQRDDVTLFGKNSLRQEWSFFNNMKKFDLRLVFLREDEEDNRSGDFSTSRYVRETQLRAEVVPGKSFTVSCEAATKLRSTDSGGHGEQRYRVESFSAAQILGYRYRTSARVSLKLGFENRSDDVSKAMQRSFIAQPSLNSSIGKKTHLSAFLKFTYTDVRSDEGKPLFFLEQGMREDWALAGQYRFTRNLSLGLNYTGRREKDYVGEVKTVHALKMECRAFF